MTGVLTTKGKVEHGDRQAKREEDQVKTKDQSDASTSQGTRRTVSKPEATKRQGGNLPLQVSEDAQSC